MLGPELRPRPWLCVLDFHGWVPLDWRIRSRRTCRRCRREEHFLPGSRRWSRL